jgi:UDP-N-acetylglucosamine 2-epimerase (non-hydrolysing)
MLKVLTVLGTRPEIIRLSRVMARLDAHPDIRHVLAHTGQNYDRELNAIFFEEMGVRAPDHVMNVDTTSLGATLGDVLRKSEAVMLAEKPDALLVLGDTNSALAAIMARRLHIPIYHMEAGNRSFDANVPEEANRRIVDHTADFNLVYTERARQHLLSEGLPHRKIYLTGSPMFEVLEHYREKIAASRILADLGLQPKSYFLVSLHREENVDYPDNLQALVQILADLHAEYGIPIVVSTHPRTRKRLVELGYDLEMIAGCRFLKPFGFLDYNALQIAAKCVLSDSGTISEESAILKFPAVTVRNSMERPEALDAGTIVISGLSSGSVQAAVRTQVASDTIPPPPAEYLVANTSERVVKLIIGTAGLAARWDNLLRRSR